MRTNRILSMAVFTLVLAASVSSANAKDNSKNNGNSNSKGSTQSAFVLCAKGTSIVARASKCRSGETKVTKNNIASLLGLQTNPEGPLASGASITGVIGGQYASSSVTATTWRNTESFSATIAQDITDNDVVVAQTLASNSSCPVLSDCYSAEEVVRTSLCTGTAANPTAPAGTVCIYPTRITNADSIRGVVLSTAVNNGFSLEWSHPGTGGVTTSVEAAWAYTAP